MNLAMWAERNGVARVTAYRWFHTGRLPVPARKVGRLILVDQLVGEAGRARTAVYARVSSADQKADLDRQVARVTALATAQQIPATRSSSRSVPRWSTRDGFCRFGSEYVLVARAAQGPELVVVDAAEVDDDLVWDMTEIGTSMCARRSGRRAAENRAQRALAAAANEDREAA
jgi:predicted site-specific integrase-resolvase